jgi:hypothetical protein
MILLLLALLKEQVVPVRKDRIDHLLLWIIQISLVVLFLTLPQAVLSEEEHTAATPEFFLACSGGKLAEIKTYLSEHHGWVNARTDNGEACLHLTGIHGHTDVTEYLLVNGADPNIRSTYEHGLRMHPLSWNIYGGHVGNVHLLLTHGADPNLDFDGMGRSKEAVTALDLVMQLIQNEEGDTRFVQLEKMLRGNGAKTMKELLGGTGEESEL